MTKPLTHALPYMVGMIVGYWIMYRTTTARKPFVKSSNSYKINSDHQVGPNDTIYHQCKVVHYSKIVPLTPLFALIAIFVALAEVFLPYKWNNSHLPTRFMAALYAALFRFGWALVLAYVVLSCCHKRSWKCVDDLAVRRLNRLNIEQVSTACRCSCIPVARYRDIPEKWPRNFIEHAQGPDVSSEHMLPSPAMNGCVETSIMSSANDLRTVALMSGGANSFDHAHIDYGEQIDMCMCGSGGSLVNRLLSLKIFSHLSRLSFVAYLIHLPIMSVFVSQTRGLFAFSHLLVIHLALSYLVMTFAISFILVHIIEFPFITFERYLFDRLVEKRSSNYGKSS